MRCDSMRFDVMRCNAIRCDAMRCDAIRATVLSPYQMMRRIERLDFQDSAEMKLRLFDEKLTPFFFNRGCYLSRLQCSTSYCAMSEFRMRSNPSQSTR
mmetsp:Transcript_13709/g.31993  ORF Transcript_13709/g.31993 Transcript_13709/m.31993 type:complete len:98 (+) Transcript_13709:153-446(+)